jgi:hypothetical protein
MTTLKEKKAYVVFFLFDFFWFFLKLSVFLLLTNLCQQRLIEGVEQLESKSVPV